ncbi:hypothetical protein ACP4OV_021875 [Aristida adscensionis]
MTHLLSELDPSGYHFKICVRVCRMWEFRGAKDDGEVKHLDLVIIDKENTAMYVEIPPTAIPYLKNKLEEGGIYNITKFIVDRAKTTFRVVDHPYMIRMNERAIINRVHPEPPSFPKYAYSLVPFELLDHLKNRSDKFLDVIGQVTAVSNAAIVQVGDVPRVKRIVILKNLSGETVELWLLGSRATEFSEQAVYEASQSAPIIAVFVGVLMKGFGKTRFLSGGSACRWYINDEGVPEIQSFYSCLDSDAAPVKQISLQDNPLMQTQIPEKTAKELHSLCPFEHRGLRFKATLTITKINQDQGWYYPACKQCHSKVVFHASHAECSKCSSVGFEDRYKLSVQADDGTKEIQLVIYDDVARQLIGKPLQRLQALYNRTDVPPEIMALVGQKYTFILKISTRKSAMDTELSFEVVYVIHQFGKQANIPLSHPFESGPSKSTTKLTPLIPIKSKQQPSDGDDNDNPEATPAMKKQKK